MSASRRGKARRRAPAHRRPAGHRESAFPGTAFDLQRLQLVALAVAAAVVVYLNSLPGDFVWDDIALVVENPAIKSWHAVKESLLQDFFFRNENELAYGYYRPVITLSYALDYLLWGLNPVGFHVTNVLLHAVNTLLVGLMLSRLGIDSRAAGLAAILFAVHPIHTENVAWIAGRTDLLAFFFCGCSLLLFLFRFDPRRGLGSEPESRAGLKPNPEGARSSTLLLGLSLICFSLALLSKEMAVILPLWLGLILVMRQRPTLKTLAAALSPYAAVLIAYGVWRFLILEVATPGELPGHSVAAVLLSLPWTVARYLLWLAFPITHQAYVQNPYVTTVQDPRLLGSLLVLLVFGLAARYGLGSRRSPPEVTRQRLLFAAMSLLALAPVVGPVRPAGPVDMGNMMAERFCYFASFPFLALVSLLLLRLLSRTSGSARRHPRLGAAGVALLALLAVVASLRTAQRNLDWRTEHDLFSLAARQAPTSPLLWAHLAVAEIVRGDMSAAGEALQKAQLVGPREYHVLAARVLYLTVDKKYEQALEVQKKIAESLEHGKAVALNNLAYLYRVTGRLDKALEILEGLLSERQAYSDVHFNLGEIYRSQGRDDRAREAYRLALEEHPDDLRFGHALLTLEFESQRYEEAERRARDLLRRHPDEPALLVNLAMIRHRQGDVEGATEILSGVVLENPEFVSARLALGSVLREKGRLTEAVHHLEVAARLGNASAEGRTAREALSEIGAHSQSTIP